MQKSLDQKLARILADDSRKGLQHLWAVSLVLVLTITAIGIAADAAATTQPAAATQPSNKPSAAEAVLKLRELLQKGTPAEIVAMNWPEPTGDDKNTYLREQTEYQAQFRERNLSFAVADAKELDDVAVVVIGLSNHGRMDFVPMFCFLRPQGWRLHFLEDDEPDATTLKLTEAQAECLKKIKEWSEKRCLELQSGKSPTTQPN